MANAMGAGVGSKQKVSLTNLLGSASKKTASKASTSKAPSVLRVQPVLGTKVVPQTNAWTQMKALSGGAPLTSYTPPKTNASTPSTSTVTKPTTVSTPKVTSASAPVSSGGGGSVSYVDPTASYQAALQKALEEAKALAKTSAESQYNSQVAGFGKTRDQALAEIQKAYDDAIASSNTAQGEANTAYNDGVKGLEDTAYKDAQLTQLVGYDRGIQNSQQLVGLMSGDNARKMNAQTTLTTERDKRINDLKDRISQLTKQKDLDTATTNSDYNYNTTQARADADKQYNDFLLQQKLDEANRIGSASSSSVGSSGGGGGGNYKTTSVNKANYDTSAQNDLLKQYSNFVQSQQTSQIDQYNQRMEAVGKKSVIQKAPALPYPSVANNPNLSAWEKYRMLYTDYPALKPTSKSVKTKK